MRDTDEKAKPTTIYKQIIIFTIKTCVVATVISVCTIFVANRILESLEISAMRTVSNVRTQFAQTSIGGQQFWSKMEQELDRAADPSSDLSPGKKEKLVNDVRVMAARLRPFVQALEE
jgi:hypothetical protein